MIRAQMDDTPPAVRIPTPEELGISRVKVATTDEPLDWSMVERKLDAVGATGYQMEKTPDGFRFTCKLSFGPVAGRRRARRFARLWRSFHGKSTSGLENSAGALFRSPPGLVARFWRLQ